MAAPHIARVTVREAALSDSGAVAELSGQLNYPITAEQAESRLRMLAGDPRHSVFVAELWGKSGMPGQAASVLGWVHVQERPTIETGLRAEVTALVVSEAHRRLGAGRVLMDRAEEWARGRGCAAVMLRSNVIRAGAHDFYEALGYRMIKTQKVFLKEF